MVNGVHDHISTLSKPDRNSGPASQNGLVIIMSSATPDVHQMPDEVYHGSVLTPLPELTLATVSGSNSKKLAA